MLVVIRNTTAVAPKKQTQQDRHYGFKRSGFKNKHQF